MERRHEAGGCFAGNVKRLTLPSPALRPGLRRRGGMMGRNDSLPLEEFVVLEHRIEGDSPQGGET